MIRQVLGVYKRLRKQETKTTADLACQVVYSTPAAGTKALLLAVVSCPIDKVGLQYYWMPLLIATGI